MKRLAPISIWLRSWWVLDGIRALQAYNLVRFSTTLLISLLLAKSGLSTTQIAIYEALLFLGNLVSFFWLGGGQNAFLARFPKLEGADKQKLYAAAFLLFQLLAVLASLVLWLLHPLLVNRLTNFDALPHFDLLCIYLLFHLPTILIPAFYLVGKQYKRILHFGFLTFPLQLIAVILPIFMGWGLRYSFWGLLIWGALKYGWLVFLLMQHAQWRGAWVPLRRLSWLAFPLMLHLMVGNSVEYIDGLIVTSFFEDEGMFAVFRYGARELPLVTLLAGALVTGLLPLVSEDSQTGLQLIRKRSLRLANLLYPLSGVLMLLSPWLFPLVFNPDFSESAWVFNVYLLIISSRLLLPQVLIISHQKNYFLVTSALIETLVNIGLSLWWVRLWGLEGIAFASVVAYLVNKINMIVYNRLVLGYKPQQYIPLGAFFSYNCLLIILFFVSKWFYAG